MNLDFELEYGKCFEVLKKYVVGPVVIAGYGVNARLFMGLMAELNIPILAVCDKNKVGQNYDYIESGKIKSYEYLKSIDEDYQIVIASEEYYENIKNTVLEYVAGKEILDIAKIKEIRKSIPLIYQLMEPFLYKKYLLDNMDRLERLNSNLSDELSKKTLVNVIKARLSWNVKYVQEIMSNDMYYIPELELGSNEIFLDGGAYDGDTAREFIKYVNGKYEKIVRLQLM